MPPKKKNFEKQLERLQAVVEELEGAELPLEKNVALYKEGLTLAKECREQLARAKNDIRLFSEGMFEEFSKLEDNDDSGNA